jgi:glutathione S-transferase
MKLFSAPASPYSRKVRIVLAEKRIDCEVERADVQPQDNPVNAYNPLGKIPTLLLDDGTAIYDSRVIVEFLDNMTANSRLIPQDNRERIAVRRWEALADGVLDAGLLIRYETLRPQGEQSAAWTGKQAARARRGLAQLQADLGALPDVSVAEESIEAVVFVQVVELIC